MTQYQWEIAPQDLRKYVTSGLYVYTTRGSRYYNDKSQLFPADGYSAIFSKLLNSKSIDVVTGLSFREAEKYFRFSKVISTGAAD